MPALAGCGGPGNLKPTYLTGRKKLPRKRPAYTVFGEDSEAVDYAGGAGGWWAGVAGALTWLRS